MRIMTLSDEEYERALRDYEAGICNKAGCGEKAYMQVSVYFFVGRKSVYSACPKHLREVTFRVARLMKGVDSILPEDLFQPYEPDEKA